MSEWDQRQLCPDGACVGLIGSDGTCKVCGRAAPNWGEERKRGLLEEPDDDVDDEDDEDLEDDDDGDEYEDDGEAGDDDEDGVAAGEDEDAPAAASAPPEWDKRKLCPDGACVGVIGDNGMCKVCGRRAA